MNPPENVLVLRFSAVGDVVLTAPALEALRLAWPRTRILVAVKYSVRVPPVLSLKTMVRSGSPLLGCHVAPSSSL